MSKIKAGMLCLVVPTGNVNTPEVVGRIVTTVRMQKPLETFISLDGSITMASGGARSWVVKSNSPLPWRVFNSIGGKVLENFEERPIFERMLKPLMDPDNGVTEEEVRALYSTRQQFSDHLTTMRTSRQCDFA